METLTNRAHDARQIRQAETVASIRSWFASEPPDKSAKEIAGPVQDALTDHLHWSLVERCESWIDLFKNAGYDGPTAEEIAAAKAHLALHHEVADLLCHELSTWVTDRSPAAPLRQALYAAWGTEELARVVRSTERELADRGDMAERRIAGAA